MNKIASQGFPVRRNASPFKESYSAYDHMRFLDMELHAQNEQFSRIINRKATDLLEDGLLIPAKFLKVENGHLIVKISKARAIPRKGEYLTAVLLEGDMPDHRNWDESSWRDLRINHQIAISEAICVWQTPANDPKFNLVGFRGVSIEFAGRLVAECVLIMGPKEPPREYLMNLRQIAESKPEHSKFLDFDYLNLGWEPTVMDPKRNFSDYVLSQLALSPYLIVQGPPGTGKTYKLAELLAELLAEGKKVLVTALTNRALIELAKKEPLQRSLELGLVTKTNLSIDELNEVPSLQNPRVENEKGELTLSTFYVCSKDAAMAYSPYYDFVIMDEASQALLSMFEATIRLGKKVLWIGDQNQLPPIVLADEKEINHNKCIPLIQGMKTVCDSFGFPSFMLNHTFRLSNRGAKFTSLFYKNALVSSRHLPENYFYPNLSGDLQFLFHPEGGPFWLSTTMTVGEKCPVDSVQLVAQIVKALHFSDRNLHIAVLSKLKKTVTQLQISINSLIDENEKVIIDTVERVQGMTCDICFFFIPNTSLSMSLNQSFFNVATSRASRHTIIIADCSILGNPVCKGGTRQYLENLNSEKKMPELKQLKSLWE
ncbi:MAG: AAA family ATPase [Prolixibacteraceae bacterium]|nr:AAA family ATPase [Prolixibacteraceae bacterium]